MFIGKTRADGRSEIVKVVVAGWHSCAKKSGWGDIERLRT